MTEHRQTFSFAGGQNGVLAATFLVTLALINSRAMPLQTRTGEVLAPGKMRLGGHIGGSFGPSKIPDAIPPELMANWTVAGRLGVAPRVEAMVDLGWVRQGAGLRFDVFNARRGEVGSLALAAAASSKPIIVRTNPGEPHPDYEWSVGFDTGQA